MASAGVPEPDGRMPAFRVRDVAHGPDPLMWSVGSVADAHWPRRGSRRILRVMATGQGRRLGSRRRGAPAREAPRAGSANAGTAGGGARALANHNPTGSPGRQRSQPVRARPEAIINALDVVLTVLPDVLQNLLP